LEKYETQDATVKEYKNEARMWINTLPARFLFFRVRKIFLAFSHCQIDVTIPKMIEEPVRQEFTLVAIYQYLYEKFRILAIEEY